ncbi:hypothetical protein OG824_31875 [Streptomyces prunicolor]|uniref:hypothetical protein n=1 Tax=Streptomyces prunicolor TaxID=67348 RepID=UPI00225AFA69|nr:hypothetical protein [Streptomyces prunicolor]MCX5239810.1 hypothetical protein [Streptomyces prunicolor]
MDLIRELTIAFVLAIVAAKMLEHIKPGRITRTLVWVVSRLVPREIRQDHYSDWCAEVDGIRADPESKGPFAAARFALGQIPFAMHLLSAMRRLKRAGDPNYVSWGQAVLLILSIPGIPMPIIPFVAAYGAKYLLHGNVTLGLLFLGVSVWQTAGVRYILRMAVSQGIPVRLGPNRRPDTVRNR